MNKNSIISSFQIQNEERQKKLNISKMRISLSQILNEISSDRSVEQENNLLNLMLHSNNFYKFTNDIESVDKNIQYLPSNSKETEQARKIVLPIIDRLRNSNSIASQKLDDLLKRNKLLINLAPGLSFDAGCEYIPPLSNQEKGTISLGLCLGCFSSKSNLDHLAVTIGHEFGHALFEERTKQNKKHISCFEIESFCDIFGSMIASDAGYNLQARSNYLNENPSGNDIHPNSEHRNKINKQFKVNEETEISPMPSCELVGSVDKKIENFNEYLKNYQIKSKSN